MKLQRMCAVCRELKGKEQLLRVVRKNDEAWVDLDGKTHGRGAYVCKSGDCLKKARKIRALERSLSCKVSSSVYDTLEAFEKDE